MTGFSLRSFTSLLIIAFLVWSETCNARRGRHWRQTTTSFTSLYKKKGSNNHKNGKSKPNQSLSHSLPNMPTSKGYSATTFNVRDYGAKGDGKSDDTKAFEAAWAAACKVEASTIFAPSEYVFLVGPISFSGPYCQHDIIFQLDGTIIAPVDAKAWGSGFLQWLDFTKLVGITIKGSGKIDGNGAVWWHDTPFDDPIDDESKLTIPSNSTTQTNLPIPISSSLGGIMPGIKPTVRTTNDNNVQVTFFGYEVLCGFFKSDTVAMQALRFYGSFNVTVTGITIQNSPQCHLKFDNCIGVSVYNFSASSPGDSPNTDGIHLQNSKDVLIRSSNVSCGDDCVSIQTGSSNVYIHNINCGPGHGISIGGLGKDNTKACVSNVTVKDIIMHNTMSGVRIKTWQGGSGSVQGLMFSNIQVSEVQIPIVIDQFYCDKSKCQNQTSAVALSRINYEKITGTYTVKPVHLACSDNMPCIDVTLKEIQLKPLQQQYNMYDPYCWQTFGQLYTPTIPPIQCLQAGKPSSSTIQADYDQC